MVSSFNAFPSQYGLQTSYDPSLMYAQNGMLGNFNQSLWGYQPNNAYNPAYNAAYAYNPQQYGLQTSYDPSLMYAQNGMTGLQNPWGTGSVYQPTNTYNPAYNSGMSNFWGGFPQQQGYNPFNTGFGNQSPTYPFNPAYNNGTNNFWGGFPQQGYDPYATNMGNFYNNYINPVTNNFAGYFTPYANFDTSYQPYSALSAPSINDVGHALDTFNDVFRHSTEKDPFYRYYQSYQAMTGDNHGDNKRIALATAATLFQQAKDRGVEYSMPQIYGAAWQVMSMFNQAQARLPGQVNTPVFNTL